MKAILPETTGPLTRITKEKVKMCLITGLMMKDKTIMLEPPLREKVTLQQPPLTKSLEHLPKVTSMLLLTQISTTVSMILLTTGPKPK